jgi:hypothetical protein
MPVDRIAIKTQIEKMNHEQQVEVLRKLNDMNGVVLNENSNGTFINLTNMSEEQVCELEKYITYVHEQENHLDLVEVEKTRIQNSYFNDNKEISNIIL